MNKFLLHDDLHILTDFFFILDDIKVGTRETGVSSAESRVLATFLMEMDGITSTPGEGIIVLAATNRLDAVSIMSIVLY